VSALRRVLVVGAGVAGLTAARQLVDTHSVTVIDKARGVGGRLATRRVGDATFDHGAQFFTTHTDEFADQVESWCAAGVARPWFRGQVGPDGVGSEDGHVRYRGVGTMNAVAKHLARDLDVRLSSRIVAIAAVADEWSVLLADGSTVSADALVITAPVPQALELLDAGDTPLDAGDRAALEIIRYDPCLAVLAPLTGPSGCRCRVRWIGAGNRSTGWRTTRSRACRPLLRSRSTPRRSSAGGRGIAPTTS